MENGEKIVQVIKYVFQPHGDNRGQLAIVPHKFSTYTSTVVRGIL
jgi:hypothetical protein